MAWEHWCRAMALGWAFIDGVTLLQGYIGSATTSTLGKKDRFPLRLTPAPNEGQTALLVNYPQSTRSSSETPTPTVGSNDLRGVFPGGWKLV